MRRINLWLVRRIAVLVCVTLIAVALLLFFGVQVSETHHGAVELINGRADTSALAVPLILFVVGLIGLLAALGWRPEQQP